MITKKEELKERLWCRPSAKGDNVDKLESWHQDKILQFLDRLKFITLKTIVNNKAGIPDILATDINGRSWVIEVKRPKGGKPTELQKDKLSKYHDNNAVTMVAYGYNDFLSKFGYIRVHTNITEGFKLLET